MKKRLLTLSLVLSFSILSGCSTGNINQYQSKSLQELYNQGHKYMVNENYAGAIDVYKVLLSKYPFEEKTKAATLDLIYVYYQKGDSELALATANQFIKLFPTYKDIGYVYYMRGVIQYNNGRGVLQQRLPYSMDLHDPENYLKAFDSLKLAIRANPNAKYATDARRRMIYINNTVAKYEYNIAEFYFKKQAYIGAIERAKIVVQDYPRSTSIESALIILVKSYASLGLNDLAHSSYEVLQKNYPNNKNLKKLATKVSNNTFRIE